MSRYLDADGHEFSAVLLEGPCLINGPDGETCIQAGWVLIEPASIGGQDTRPTGVSPEVFQKMTKVEL